MRKILISLVITLTLVLGAVFPLLTSTTLSAKAAAVEESTDAIDDLFVLVGAELTVEDENYNIVPGAKSDYLAEFDESGKCIKSGFKLIEVGDFVGGKTIYVYRKSSYISACIDFSSKTTIEANADVEYALSLGYAGIVYVVEGKNSSTAPHIVDAINLTDSDYKYYQKITLKSDTHDLSKQIVAKTIYSGTQTAGYTCFTPCYLYYTVDNENSDESSSEESSSSDVESSEESSEEISEELKPGESEEEQESEELKPGESEEESKTELVKWFENNLGITVSSTVALLIVALLAWLIFKK